MSPCATAPATSASTAATAWGARRKLRFLTLFLSERVGQHLGHVPRSDGGQMLDLMPAACAGGDYHCPERLAPDLLGERLGHFEGQLVLGGKGAKGPGHAAATSVEQGNLPFGQPFRQPFHETRMHQRLDVAMSMDDEIRRFGVEREGAWLMAQ